jgi:hypothetical protein
LAAEIDEVDIRIGKAQCRNERGFHAVAGYGTNLAFDADVLQACGGIDRYPVSLQYESQFPRPQDSLRPGERSKRKGCCRIEEAEERYRVPEIGRDNASGGRWNAGAVR